MGGLPLFVPKKQVSAWVTETQPREARAWLESLPLADDGEAAQDIYHALYALNRLEVPHNTRLELMELYQGPVATVSSVLTSQFAGLGLPLPADMRKLAEFIRRLQMEMAIGYKVALHDVGSARRGWGRRNQPALTVERAMDYLGAVLLRSYQVYMPQPPSVWQEIHALYGYAEEQGILDESVERYGEKRTKTTISLRYRRILLLGLCNPYQLPQNECFHIDTFLEARAGKASIKRSLKASDPAGHFVIDLDADAPPIAVAQRSERGELSSQLRVLNTIELARVVHGFIKRLDDGAPVSVLGLGLDLKEAACHEMLRRMIKFWGLTPKRQYSRTKTQGHLSICKGINALHFFGSGRKPFTPPLVGDPEATPPEQKGVSQPKTAAAVSVPPTGRPTTADAPSKKRAPRIPRWLNQTAITAPETYLVDRWQLRDESARGLLLSRDGDQAMHVRVGDLLGVQGPSDGGVWRVGVIRWVKSPEAKRVEMGIERLAPEITPVAVRPVPTEGSGLRYTQALLLPAMPVLQRPETLLVGRGVYEPDRSLYIVTGDAPPRVVRPLKLLERSASFDQIVFTEVAQP
ncbi:MAG: hypothetical protein ACE5K1_11945 [Acidiferrobacterales bacterium]